ncbi:MAG: tetratricopeptide repeat protein, partial [Xenococcaceae cyanobacterium MO_207.B15]|nr:tetratricopeptide repeat protein [Xenococcaceae cyanobacterium MO_207.B15]
MSKNQEKCSLSEVMLRFFSNLRRWIKSRFVRNPPPAPPPKPTEFSDLEYEDLFMELLAEVAQGSSWGELQGYLTAKKLDQQRLASWLRGFGEGWLEQPEAHQELARRLGLLGRVATGELAEVAKSLSARLSFIEKEENQDTNWNNLGITLVDLGKLEEAVASYDQALKLQPDYPDAWNNRGNALWKLGRYEEAVASYDQAL